MQAAPRRNTPIFRRSTTLIESAPWGRFPDGDDDGRPSNIATLLGTRSLRAAPV
jgi:hypothetical protein